MKFLKKHLFVYSLVFLSLLVISIWFRDGLIKGGAEEGLMFYNPQRTLQHSLNLWWDVDSGFSNLAWLPQATILLLAAFFFKFLNIPNFVIQAATYLMVLTTGAVSLYLFVNSLLKTYSDRKLVSFIAGIFYIFNPFSISQVWSRSLSDQTFSFALLPLGAFLFWKGMEQKKWIYIVYFFLSTILFSAAFGVSTFIITFWSVITLILGYWLLQNRKNIKLLSFGAVYYLSSVLLWLVGNAWWTFPTIFSGKLIYSGYLGNANENISTLIGVSNYYTPDWLIRLLQKHYFIDSQPFGHVYALIPLQIISWLIPIFLIAGLVAILKKREFKAMYLILVIFLAGLIISLGANWPFGKLFILIFKKASILQAFRNPFEKYGIVYALGYSPIFALGLVELIQRPRYILNSVLFFKFETKFKAGLKLRILIGGFFLILICGIYAWPMWVGKPISGPDWQRGVKVPEGYRNLNTWLNSNNPDQRRVFMTPLLEGEGAVFSWNNLVYNGADPMLFILDSAVISSSPSIPYFYDFARNIRDYFGQKSMIDALSLLRVGFIVNRTDLEEINEVSKMQFDQLTRQYFKPTNVALSNPPVCVNLTCQLGKEALQEVKFLHLWIFSDQDANLDVSLSDSQGHVRRWYSVTNSEYFIHGQRWEELVIPFNTPTVGYKLNLDSPTSLSISAHPIGLPNSLVNNLLVRGVGLDPGIKVSVPVFEFVNTFDKLSLYRPPAPSLPPKVGNLEKVQIVEDFGKLFDEASENKSQLDKVGFLVALQNKDKNFTNLAGSLNSGTVQVQEFPNNVFWLHTPTASPTYLLLSENFHRGWKVLEKVDKPELDGSPIHLIRLLQKSYLPESTHFVVNGYANVWKTTGVTDNYAIVFLPQIWANLGKQVSIAVMLGSLITIIINIIKNRKNAI